MPRACGGIVECDESGTQRDCWVAVRRRVRVRVTSPTDGACCTCGGPALSESLGVRRIGQRRRHREQRLDEVRVSVGERTEIDTGLVVGSARPVGMVAVVGSGLAAVLRRNLAYVTPTSVRTCVARALCADWVPGMCRPGRAPRSVHRAINAAGGCCAVDAESPHGLTSSRFIGDRSALGRRARLGPVVEGSSGPIPAAIGSLREDPAPPEPR